MQTPYWGKPWDLFEGIISLWSGGLCMKRQNKWAQVGNIKRMGEKRWMKLDGRLTVKRQDGFKPLCKIMYIIHCKDVKCTHFTLHFTQCRLWKNVCVCDDSGNTPHHSFGIFLLLLSSFLINFQLFFPRHCGTNNIVAIMRIMWTWNTGTYVKPAWMQECLQTTTTFNPWRWSQRDNVVARVRVLERTCLSVQLAKISHNWILLKLFTE